MPTVGLGFWLTRSLEWPLVAAWWTSCNAFVLPLWAYDKWQARRGGWRVPEATLHTVAVLGGAPVALLSMTLLRHKTQKPAFRRLYWFICALQVAALGYWWFQLRPD